MLIFFNDNWSRHKVTTSRGVCRAARATYSGSRLPVGVRALTELGFAGRPRQRSMKGVEGVEETVGVWQRDLANEILRRRDRTPIEGGDPAHEHVDEAGST